MQDNIANLRILAQRAKETGDYSGAVSFYRQILVTEPSDWESVFYEAYCSMADFSVASISANANRLKLIFEKTYDSFLVDLAVKKSQNPTFDMTIPMMQVAKDITMLLLAMRESAMNFYQKFPDTGEETEERLRALGIAALGVGDVYYSYSHKTLAANFYKLAQTLLGGVCNIGDTAVKRIREVDPSFSLPKEQTEQTEQTDYRSFFKWFGICFCIPAACVLILLIINA